MTHHVRSRLWMASVSLLGLAAPHAAHAREARKQVEEVTVTAQKRRTNLMRTPVAISALSGATLQTKGVVDLTSLASTVPSLSVSDGGPTSAVNIRGIGLSVVSPNVASGVPIYRDGLFTSPLLPDEPLYDIKDVEVERGPQGTLVGTNSTGGAVFINSQDPVLGTQPSGWVQVKGGSYNDIGLQGAVNLPVSDTLSVRVAGNWETRDSPWTNIGNNTGNYQTPGNLDQKDIRIGVLWKPNDAFTLLVKENYQQDNNGGLAQTPFAGTPAAIGYPTAPYVLNYTGFPSYWRDLQSRTSIEARYVFPDGITLRSITGYTYTQEYYSQPAFTNTSGTTAVVTPLMNHIEDHVMTQEFNLLSPSGARFHWVVGTYSQYWPAHIKLQAPTTAPVSIDQGTDKIANGFFGEGGYNLTQALEVHVGLRYTFDNTYSYGHTFLALPGATIPIASQDAGEVDGLFTGRVGVDWKITPSEFGYVLAAKGAKVGGINGAGIPNFAPESVYDYEVGLKSSLFGGQVHTQIDGFYMDYQRLQLSTVSPAPGQGPVGSITNAGNSTIDGGEFSGQARLGNLELDANASYVHSSVSAGALLNSYLYQSRGLAPIGLQCAPGQSAGCFNYTPFYSSVSGAPNPFSPTWTANLGVQYDVNLADGDTLSPRVDFSYTSPQIATVFNNPVDRFQARRLLNLSLTYVHGPWTAAAYATNLLNEYYIVGQTQFQNLWGDPRQFGVRVMRSF